MVPLALELGYRQSTTPSVAAGQAKNRTDSKSGFISHVMLSGFFKE